MKRCVDIVLSFAGFILFLPAFILIPILIKMDDDGPVFFIQPRLGQFKRLFHVYKFRTMRDQQVTRLGRWLRSTGLDEIPQFVNILQGSMSFVGPRPLTVQDVRRLTWDKHYYNRRWLIKPGITGLAQLYAGKSAHHSWLFDKTYINHTALLLDAKIMIMSFLMTIIGKQPIRQWLYRKSDHMNWKVWLDLFSDRRDRLIPAKLQDQSDLPGSAALAKSLAIFSLGESGGGTVIQQALSSRIKETDTLYCKAIAAIVDEEHRHSQILALCVESLGGNLISRNWTADLFIVGRRLMGLRLKILVLLAAEVVGICYYKLLAMRLPPGQLKTLLDELTADEESHLKFHIDFLHTQTHGRIKAALFMLAWRLVTLCAALVVTVDHHQTLKQMGIPIAVVWHRWMYIVSETETQILSHKPDCKFLEQLNIKYNIQQVGDRRLNPCDSAGS